MQSPPDGHCRVGAKARPLLGDCENRADVLRCRQQFERRGRGVDIGRPASAVIGVRRQQPNDRGARLGRAHAGRLGNAAGRRAARRQGHEAGGEGCSVRQSGHGSVEVDRTHSGPRSRRDRTRRSMACPVIGASSILWWHHRFGTPAFRS
jgi:hypothetical protein